MRITSAEIHWRKYIFGNLGKEKKNISCGLGEKANITVYNYIVAMAVGNNYAFFQDCLTENL